MTNIWQELPKPFFILAPMDDVTDTVFRQVMLTTAKPDLFFTEFANVDGLISKDGSKTVGQKLKFSPIEKPLIAQIWGNDPEHFFKAASKIKPMGFDGIDINFGCPVHDVVKKHCGGGAIGDIKLVGEIAQATHEGSGGMPLSIKTRLGIKKIETEDWVGKLLTLPLSALTLHARTVDEMSKVPAHWDEIKKAVDLRNKLESKILIIGNGDVKDREDGLNKARETGVDGIMIGRGIFHNIYAFADKNPTELNISKRLQLLTYHTRLYQETWGDTRPFANLKKYFKIYLSGFDGASEMRVKFMETKDYEEVFQLANQVAINP